MWFGQRRDITTVGTVVYHFQRFYRLNLILLKFMGVEYMQKCVYRRSRVLRHARFKCEDVVEYNMALGIFQKSFLERRSDALGVWCLCMLQLFYGKTQIATATRLISVWNILSLLRLLSIVMQKDSFSYSAIKEPCNEYLFCTLVASTDAVHA